MEIHNRQQMRDLFEVYDVYLKDSWGFSACSTDNDFFELYWYNQAETFKVMFNGRITYHIKHYNGDSYNYSLPNEYKDKILKIIKNE